jgi:hypothetical protein
MLGLVVGAVLCLSAGFGLGRVRNAGKLAAIKAEVVKVEASVVAEVQSLVAAIKSHL